MPASWLALLLAAPLAAQQAPANPPPSAADDAATAKRNAAIAAGNGEQKKDETLVLSPFVVSTTKDTGYYASNTLAGSRLNTNIADLAASISVITKQQMEDTASVDINDVFRYEINTEGSSTYTPTGSGYLTLRSDGVLDVASGAATGSSVTPFTNASANRVRGLGVPSAATNYYPSIGQVPFDAYNVQSVEISRGPNSMIFGMGSPAGIVNQSTAQAQIGKNTQNVSVRVDQYGSYRGTFSFNRSLSDKLAIYAAVLYDNRQFERKPSYDLTRRQYGAFTFKPFAKTTIRANVEYYKNDNRRPNTLTPRDFVTQWNLAGQPYYDPLTRQITRNGKVAGDYVINASSPYASEVRDFIRALPDYNPALRGTSATNFNGTDANFTFYNGFPIFGQAALTTSTGFVGASNTPSGNKLFVPGLTFIGTSNQARSVMMIADGNLVKWFQPLYSQKYRTQFGTAANPAANADLFPTDAAIWANPTWAAVYNRDFSQSAGWTGIGNGIIGYKYPGVTDKSIYDWENVNINQMNFGEDKNTNYNVELEQELLPNLYLNAGWFRQDFESYTNYTVAQLNVATLFVDTNKNLVDGTANPYFGKPYVEDFDPDRYVNLQRDDHYRAMLAYTPDFTRHNGWLKWLGRHQILALASRDESMQTQLRQRLEYIDSSSLIGKTRYMANPNANADGTATGWNYQTTSLTRKYYLASPGDPNGVVTRSSGEWNPLTYTGDITVYDYANSKVDTVNMTTTFNTFDASTVRNQRIVDSLSAATTSYLWGERLIATVGVRQDKYKARVTSNAALKDDSGATVAPALTNPQKWVNGLYNTDLILNRWDRWDRLKGTTRTYGGVLRPFRGWANIDNRANNGSLWWQFVRDFGVSYNQSDNFNAPAQAQVDAFGNPLPKPTGEGKDYGFQFALFDNKLFASVKWFDASNQNERTNPGTSISRLTGNVDTTLFRNWARTIAMINMGMDPRVAGFGSNLTPSQESAVQAAAEVIWKQPYTYYDGKNIFATRNGVAKGVEAEINYNPTRNWTMKLTFGRQDAKYSNVLKEFDAWYAQRYPVWQAAKATDYLLPQYQSLATYTNPGGRAVDLTNFLTSYGFRDEVFIGEPNGNNNVQQYYNSVVAPQALLARDLEGQSAPGQRKNRFSLLTSYSFTEGRLKGFFVGGSERWEDKSVIGYYGKASGANGTQLDVSDTNRPIYDSSNSYTDIWIGYNRQIWKDKVKMKLQLNCVNVFENGGLQVVSVNYDGSPYAFRIVDPRQFIFSASFDF